MEKIDITKEKTFTTLPILKSTDTDWMNWSDLVVGQYGNVLGKQIFISHWQKRGSRDANTRALRMHLQDKHNIVIDESAWDKIVDVGGGIGDTFGKIFKVGKWTLIIGGSLVLVAVAFSAVNAVKKGVPSK